MDVPTTVSSSFAVSRRPGHLDVFRRNWHGAIDTIWLRPEDVGWRQDGRYETEITPGYAAADASRVCAVSRQPDQIDLFWVGRRRTLESGW